MQMQFVSLTPVPKKIGEVLEILCLLELQLYA